MKLVFPKKHDIFSGFRQFVELNCIDAVKMMYVVNNIAMQSYFEGRNEVTPILQITKEDDDLLMTIVKLRGEVSNKNRIIRRITRLNEKNKASNAEIRKENRALKQRLINAIARKAHYIKLYKYEKQLNKIKI